ncbi:O-antigen ligase family protein [Shewanella eurypsychrophilus]|uniref:O-antigen ligase family protein n=1 Tax=Shewanella eurypsychrophilus TaxID=2593656 RepID=A0ABX6V7R1_9GAMM|nr:MULTISPECIES: O-antigen ligase family protein [Shewanella]QFU23437.1 hypothetical protein FS418_17325 [Shewanella sp. YLB-09]QPG58665.1 O-antigen ligase family protein [Shewanella eurypsychrophilus]
MTSIALATTRFKYSYLQLFLALNVILLPFFDNISGALFKLGIMGDGSLGSPSQLGRLIATIFVVFLILKYCSHYAKLLAITILCYFLFIESVSALFHRELIPFLFGIVMSTKVIFCSFCIIFFVDICRKGLLTKNQIEYWVILYGTIISILVLTAYLSGFHISNYSKGIATRGLFVSGNGLGVVMGSCALILVHRLQTLKLFKLVHILLLLVTTALIGTKGGLIFFAIGMIYLLLKIGRSFPIVSIILALVTSYYLLFPLLELLGSVFENIIYKFNHIDNKWTLLASSRDKFIINAFNIVDWEGLHAIRFLFGAGAYYAYLDPSSAILTTRKLLENDLFELFFSYGVMIPLLYIATYFVGVFKAFKTRNYFYVLLLSLIFFHSITAGHVIFNGTSSIMLAFTLALIFSHKVTDRT